MPRGAVLALSHGGGPMPVLGDPGSASIVRSLKGRAPDILRLNAAAAADRPRAIVLVTAHWSRADPTVSSGAKHRLYYDYGGFPAEAYRLRYDAPGSPEVAARLAELLRDEGMRPELDPVRGWDHGVFVPMLLVRPEADVPIVQLSVLASEDPAQHFAVGRALARLRDENVAVVGSGFASFHNLMMMRNGATRAPGFKQRNGEWSDKVTAATQLESSRDREEAFKGWRSWPAAYESHPDGGAEHFMPLLVCAGAAGDGKAEYYVDEFMGIDIYSYYWK
jgi:aromatic ring-opening dioxygenase catalytic subunit (LigB family)